jgi:hypothetical protein
LKSKERKVSEPSYSEGRHLVQVLAWHSGARSLRTTFGELGQFLALADVDADIPNRQYSFGQKIKQSNEPDRDFGQKMEQSNEP